MFCNWDGDSSNNLLISVVVLEIAAISLGFFNSLPIDLLPPSLLYLQIIVPPFLSMARTRKPTHAPQEEADLDQALADFIKKYGRKESTISKYEGEIRRAQDFARSRADLFVKDPSTNKEGHDPEKVAQSLSAKPNHLSVTMLLEYTSHRCLHKGWSYSVATGIQGAFSWLWKTSFQLRLKYRFNPTSGDGYSGAYFYREDVGVCGNPTAAESFKELMHALCRRDKETVRNHAEAFTYEDGDQLFNFSFSQFSAEELCDVLKELPQDPALVAFALYHARIRAMVSLCWTCWLRIGELINLQWKDFEFTVAENGHTIYKLPEYPEHPEILQVYKHMKQYVELLQAYHGSFDKNDYVFCSVRKHTVYKKTRTAYTTMLDFVRKFTTSAGLEADYTTHCFRRGGAAWRFIHAPPEFLWGLIRCQIWGGWRQGEQIGTMIKYVMDERERARDKENDPLDLDPDKDKRLPPSHSSTATCSCGGHGGELFKELKALILELEERVSQMSLHLLKTVKEPENDFKAAILDMEEHLTQRILQAMKAPEDRGSTDADFQCYQTTNTNTGSFVFPSNQFLSRLTPAYPGAPDSADMHSVRLPTPTHTPPSFMYPAHPSLNQPTTITTSSPSPASSSSSSSFAINQHVHQPTPTYIPHSFMYPVVHSTLSPPTTSSTTSSSASASSSQAMNMWPSYIPQGSVAQPTLNPHNSSSSSSNPPPAMWPSYHHTGLAWPWLVPNHSGTVNFHASPVVPTLPIPAPLTSGTPPSGLSRSNSRSYNSESFQPGINLSTNPPLYDENNVPPMHLRRAAFPHVPTIKAAIEQWTQVDRLLQRAPKDWPKAWYCGVANTAVAQTRTNRSRLYDAFVSGDSADCSFEQLGKKYPGIEKWSINKFLTKLNSERPGYKARKRRESKRLDNATMAHFVIEEQLFTKIQGSLCRAIPSTLPSKIAHEPERGINLQSLLEINWVSQEFPFLMAVPIENPFSAPLFDRLDYSENHFPVVYDGKGFRLRHRTSREWEDLELNLRAVIYAMSEICLIHLPQNFRFWASPRRYGHTRLHKSMGIAQSVALQSRNSFIPFIAAATFYLTLMNTQFTHPPIGSTWREAVLNRTGVHRQWLSELELSVAGDLCLERVGAIFDPNQFPSLLPSLTTINMPILIWWGPVSNPRLHDASDYLRKSLLVPTNDELKLLQSGRPLPHSSLLHPTSPLPQLPSSPLPPPAAEPLHVWKEFFLRRQMANELRLQRESSVDRQARESRANHALRQEAPGKKGARVFIWEDVDGNRIRKPIGRRHVEDIWMTYGSQQRIYDPFRDEWDLCTDFGDGSDSDDDDDANEDDGANEDFTPQPSPPVESPSVELLPPEPLLLPVGPQSSISDLERDHGLDSGGAAAAASYSFSFPDAAEDRGHDWYGIIATPHSAVPPPVDMKITWSVCRQYLGNGRWLESPDVVAPAPLPPTSTQLSMCTFFHKLLTSQKIDDLPDALYDLRTQHPDQPVFVSVRTEIMEGATHFFIRPQESTRPEYDVSWEVKLTSAAATLGILRRPDLDFVGIVHHLLDKGISFRTCIIGPPRPPPFPTQFRHSGLGYRPPNYQPDMLEYTTYLSHRNELLRGPRGRAALLSGGIISRLAREVVQYQHVLDGPTGNVYDTGAMIQSQAGVGYWDDTLTEHEIHIICGVYKSPAQPMKTTQTTDLSWWPKPSAWDSAGINLGFWSEDCERWFQGHLTKLKDGKFVLRSPAAWKSALRFNKDAIKVTLKNEKLAAEYLARRDLAYR
ncbi:hypothetical protein H0H93_007133 [Arthromyces matolae]|nr:hypothetical protein H0H93_007133 [Arthromyces matolae]